MSKTNEIPFDESTSTAVEKKPAPISKTQALTPTQQEAQDTIRKLPAQLQPVAACFSRSLSTFIKSFPDEKTAGVAFNRECLFAAQAMMANPYLITCAKSNPEDLTNALMNIALTGSTLNPVLKQGYLVPFKGKITFMASYMGLVDILVKSGLANKVEAHAVFEGDEFEMTHGTRGKLYHKPDYWGKKSADTLKGCYYYIVLTDGSELFDVLSKAEIDAIKQRSPSVGSGKQSPWDTDYIEMAKKTAIRRGFKMCPKTSISEDKLNAIAAVFDRDEKEEQDWIERVSKQSQVDTFDEDTEFTQYEEMPKE